MKKLFQSFFILSILFVFLSQQHLLSTKSAPFPPGTYKVLRLSMKLTSKTNLSRFPKNYPVGGHFTSGDVTLYTFFFPNGGPSLLQLGWITLTDYHYIGTCGGWIKIPRHGMGATMFDVSFYNLILKGNNLLIGGRVSYSDLKLMAEVYCPPKLAKEETHPLFELFAIFNENSKSNLSKYFLYKIPVPAGRTIQEEKCFHNLLINSLTIKIKDLGIMHSLNELKEWSHKNHTDEKFLKLAIEFIR